MELGHVPLVLLAELIPLRPIVGGQAGERRRKLGVLDLEWIARRDPDPRDAACGNRRERADVVLDDRVGLELAEDLYKPIVDVSGAVQQRLPGRRDEASKLLASALTKHRRRVANEVLPE